ncbi:hypothetical protein F7734_08805 [Scytonema sp. UIC 10036]|uniref:hypothetical protein n=1 Tax=Scytonema sp. UIC 10036 TaxID=2304196 RepID=UPI0012DA914C|nr:hypothetical protein [Scytonema sp. UIC 10036]MUG92554.1 hypothetical protein [Scytonema sp. UIC 10036]
MNNYLNQLVAKNLNLVDTVQPFLLSIFGFLPGSSIELGNEQNWGINQEIVTGDNQDSAITTGLETSPEAHIFRNSDIAQPLDLQAIAAPTSSTNANQSQTSDDINDPPSTSLTPRPTHYWEQPDSQQSPRSMAIASDKSLLLNTETQPLTLAQTTQTNTPLPHQTVKQLTQPAKQSLGQEPVKSHPGVSLPQYQQMVSKGKSPMIPESELVVTEQTSDKILPTVEKLQLTSTADVEAIASLSFLSVKSQHASVPLLTQQQGTESDRFVPSSPSLKVMREQPDSPQSPQPMAIAPDGSLLLNTETQPLTLAPTTQTNTPLPYQTVKQLTQPTKQSLGQEPVKSHPGVSLPQYQQMVSKGKLPMIPESEPVVTEQTSDKILPSVEKPQLTSTADVEAIAPLSSFSVKSQSISVPLLTQQQGTESDRFVPSSPSSKVMREQPDSQQLPQPMAIASDKSLLLNTETQPLTLAQTTQTNTPLPHQTVKQLTQPVKQSLGQEPVKSHLGVSLPQYQQMVSKGKLPMIPESEPVVTEQTSDKILPSVEKPQLTSTADVEAIAPLSSLPVKSQSVSEPLLTQQQETQNNRFVPPSPSLKVMREQPDSQQSPQPMAIAPDQSLFLNTEIQPLTPAPTTETSHPGIEQLTQPAKQSLGQLPVKSYPAVPAFQSQQMVSLGKLPTIPESEPAVIKRTSDKILPTEQRLQLTSSSHGEAIAPLLSSAVKSQPVSVPLLTQQQETQNNRFVSSSPSSKVMREQPDSQQSPQPMAIAPDKSLFLNTETHPLTPAATTETNTPFSHQAVEQLTQPAKQLLGQQAVKIHPISLLQDHSPQPTPNIIEPRNDDSRPDSIFISASRQERQQRESFAHSTTPTIQVSIGSMEIRTPLPPPRPKPRPKPPVMSLDEYLRQRSRGR